MTKATCTRVNIVLVLHLRHLQLIAGLIIWSVYCSSSTSNIVQAHELDELEHKSVDVSASNINRIHHQQYSHRPKLPSKRDESKSKFPRLWPLPYHFTSGEIVNSTSSRSGAAGNATRRYITFSLEQAHSFHLDLKWISTSIVNADHGISSVDDDQAASIDATENSPILSEAFERYRSLIFSRPVSSTQSSDQAIIPLISSLLVRVHSPHDTLCFGVDESYELAVPHPANASQASIQANTIFGALRGLETFSQLCVFDFKTRRVQIRNAPWFISDKPRFPYRGLLIDTARHYQPPRVIKQVIDAMSYAKLNVLHWHIVDTQSFPLEIPSYPKLWQASFSQWERYTNEDAQDIVEYARKRGINIMAELDVPGHAASWGIGYPEVWPSRNCTQPLDVSGNFTFRLIDGIITDFAKVFPFDFMHMGGDEVNTSCWTQTPRIKKWLKRNNYTGADAYKHFVLQAEELSVARGYTPVNWEEPFDVFGAELNKKTVIHNWLGRDVAAKVVKAGFRCIVSNVDAWYLDQRGVPWQTFYSREPWTNITDARERELVLGGEVCMWGETVDASDIHQTIWPRAAAAAERLWSSLENLADEPQDALPRLRHFRCLLNERGIAAAPVETHKGRDPPSGPGSCYSQ